MKRQVATAALGLSWVGSIMVVASCTEELLSARPYLDEQRRGAGGSGTAGGGAGGSKQQCGNGMTEAGEDCDDQNKDRGDGCDETCHVEPCWTCPGGLCTPTNAGTSCNMAIEGGSGVVCDGMGHCLGCLPAEIECDPTGGDVDGGCRYCPGRPCSEQDGSTYCSNKCVDGFCCNDACAAECYACNVHTYEGTCTPVPYMETDEPSCISKEACDGEGACRTADGKYCAGDGECVSGTCRGVCSNDPSKVCSMDDNCNAGTCDHRVCVAAE